MTQLKSTSALAALSLVLSIAAVSLTARAAEDPISELANAICAAPDINAVTSALTSLAPEDAMLPEEVGEAFGVATFLGDLQRCANRQAIADGFAFYKKGKDGSKLDAAFAMGRVAAKPEGGTASAQVYQGSFSTLGTAGDAPSGQ
ncbi:MAG: hypothetical protein K8S25_08075 [Alphaproteobacteria bacterium]|nr:hypothetical protein [Alphaproteobacteria bacterium]